MHRNLVACAAAIAAVAIFPSAAMAWAPASSATVNPGVQMFTDGAQCTANFVFTDATDTYIGYAAHCAGLGEATDTNGCDAGSLPLGTPVEIDGASRPGTLAYSSWLAMQAANETNADACAYNDFALVKLDPADVSKTNPSVPGFGGPTGTASLPSGVGSTVYTYGNSSLRGGVSVLRPKQGVVVQKQGGGWSTDVHTLTPGIPGDSGSGVMTGDGKAAGTLSTVQLAPLTGSNGVSDLPREVAYMRSHGGPQATVANGTEPFNANLATAILGG